MCGIGSYLVAFVVLMWRRIYCAPRNPSLARCPKVRVPLRCSQPPAMVVHIFICVLMHLSRHWSVKDSLVRALLLAGWAWARLRSEDVKMPTFDLIDN